MFADLGGMSCVCVCLCVSVNVDCMGGFNHCVFSLIIHILEQQKEDVGGSRLQCLKKV